MNSKNLHKHAIPVIFFSVAVFSGIAALSLQVIATPAGTAAALTSSVISVTPKQNGLADVHITHADTNAPAKALDALNISVPLSVGLSAASQ